ncbi:armadillo-type protein [Pyronema domesticum]|nr:armadillo-type protein [Pyronema domesticum]
MSKTFSTTMHDRHLLDEKHHRVGDGQHFPATYAPLRPTASELNNHNQSVPADLRAGLTRRFTTDAMNTPQFLPTTWDPSRYPRMPVAENMEYLFNREYDMEDPQKYQMMQYDARLQEQRELEMKVKLMQLQTRKDEEDILRLARTLDRMNMGRMKAGLNEPTTPPEFRDSAYGRTKTDISAVSLLATPPTVSNRLDQQQLITPPAEDVLSHLSQSNSRSVPGTRRNSDENQVLGTPTQAPIGQRPSLRNSMTGGPENLQSRFGLGQVTTDFLFDDEKPEKNHSSTKDSTTSPGIKSYLQMVDTVDKFPILTQSHPGKLSASSAALDLAYSDITNGQDMWSQNFTRSHRPAQHSLPVNNYPYTPTSNSSPKVMPQTDSPAAPRRFERSSTDFSFSSFGESVGNRVSQQSEANGHSRQGSMPKLQSSFSTNDLPTMRNGSNIQTSNIYGRGPIDRQRHNRDLTIGTSSLTNSGMFGPPLSAGLGPMMMSPTGMSGALPSPGPYGGYGHINLSSVYGGAPYGAYPAGPSTNKFDTPHQSHNMQGRSNMVKRGSDGEVNRFANVKLESLVNEIYSLCKDQHGCRYLQKKLEEGNPQYVEMIFNETHAHVVELMTDPFGNYLCQKLLEHTNNEQRTVLVNTAAPRLVEIALNQHGTRALQKMIDFLSCPEQIDTIVHALESKVVELIQDLNGNHVIQKCLNKLRPEDAQFIFDAVGEHCIPVGTHRHGCCVLQRCIDHASGNQKIQLIQKITAHSLQLVQDAFGNYVVQYILDLGEPQLSEPVILQFCGMLCELAKQKFSSNVIEKCIRVAEPPTKKILIEELIASNRIDELLRDCYANYVIQTSIDYADATTRTRLADAIMPLLPTIRNFPYGRRIQSKLSMVENKANGGSSGAHSRSNSYSQSPSQARPPINGGMVRPSVQQNQFPPTFGGQYLM